MLALELLNMTVKVSIGQLVETPLQCFVKSAPFLPEAEAEALRRKLVLETHDVYWQDIPHLLQSISAGSLKLTSYVTCFVVWAAIARTQANVEGGPSMPQMTGFDGKLHAAVPPWPVQGPVRR